MDFLNKNIELIKGEIKSTIVQLEKQVSILMRNRTKAIKDIQERNQSIAGMEKFLGVINNFLCDDMLIPTIMMDFKYLTYWLLKINVSGREKFDTLMEVIKRNYVLMHLDEGRKVIVITKEDTLFINKNKVMKEIFEDGQKVSQLLDKYYSKEKLTEEENRLVSVLLKKSDVFEKNIKATTTFIYQKYFLDKSIHDLEDVSSIIDNLKIMGVNDSMLCTCKECLLCDMRRFNRGKEKVMETSIDNSNTLETNPTVIHNR